MTNNTKRVEVERFTKDVGMGSVYPSSTGEWVRYSDYAALEAEVAGLRDVLADAMRWIIDRAGTKDDWILCDRIDAAMGKESEGG